MPKIKVKRKHPHEKKSAFQVRFTKDEKARGKIKFPDCKGQYPDCPNDLESEEETKACMLCPFFK